MTDLYDFDDLHDSTLTLSSHALSALQEFLSEQREAEDAFSAMAAAQLKNKKRTKSRTAALTSGNGTSSSSTPSAVSEGSTSEDSDDADADDSDDGDDDGDDSENDDDDGSEVEEITHKLTMASFKEDWQLSQFWYDDATAKTMGDEMVRQANGGMIVCVSAPTCFLYLKNLDIPNPLILLEIDTRFAVFPEFRLYDYTKPLDVDGLEEGGALRGAAAAVVLDPPFLNEDCASKSAETVRALCNKDTSVLVSTGWTVRKFMERDLNARITKFRPRHKGGLANAFRCYVNYTSSVDDFTLDSDTEDGDNDFEGEELDGKSRSKSA